MSFRVLVALLLLVVPAFAEPVSPAIMPADPKAAILVVADKWLAAYLKGDLDALLAVSQGIEGEQRETVDAIVEAVRERNNLVAAIYAAFPAAEANHWPDDPVEKTLAEAREGLAKATVKVEGDGATIAFKNSWIAARLTRQPDGRWLFDTFRALTTSGRVRNVLAEERADSQTCRELTARVKAGDFQAVEPIRARYVVRLNQLIEAAATQPAK